MRIPARKRILLLVVFVLVAAVATGCATIERGEFSGTRFDPGAFKGAKVGVLPVAVNPSFSPRGLHARALQEAVSDAVQTALAIPVRPVTDVSEPAINPFPYTVQRLADAARRLKQDALIGVSVSSWEPSGDRLKTGDGQARATLMITFSAADPSGPHWAVTGTWSAPGNAELAAGVRTPLVSLLHDMKAGLAPHPIAAYFSRPKPPGPILTFSGSETLRKSGNQTDQKYVDLVVTTIDEAGIESLGVATNTSGYQWKLEGRKDEWGELPVFLSAKVRVPLAHGRNRIEMTATTAATEDPVANRELTVETTARHQLYLLAIGSEPAANSAAAGFSREIDNMDDAKSRYIPGTSSGLVGIVPALREADQHALDGDTVVVYVAGAVQVINGILVLGVPDVPRLPRDVLPILLQEIVDAGPAGDRMLVLDLCSNDADIADVRTLLAAMLNGRPRTLARVRPCSLESKPLLDTLSLVLTGSNQARYANDYFEGVLATPRDENGRFPDILGGPQTAATVAAAEGSAAVEVQDFYVVVHTVDTQDEAHDYAAFLRSHGTRAGVLQGTSGTYVVVTESAGNVKDALEHLRKARLSGQAPKDAYVLPPSRIGGLVERLEAAPKP